MVEGTKITGIIDWDAAGFFPEYAEYAFNMLLNQGMEDWWKPVLKELLTPCPKEICQLTELAQRAF